MLPRSSYPFSKNEPVDIVLGGGGIKGFSHIGALQAITDRGLTIGNVDCVSIGSVVGTFFKNNVPLASFVEIFLDELERFDKSAFARALRQPRPVKVIGDGGVVDPRPLFESMIERHKLTVQPDLRIIAAQRVGCKFRPYFFESNYDLPTALCASCALPPFIKSVFVQDQGRKIRLVDGGLFHPAPFHFCRKPSIILRLGMAQQLPQSRLPALDLVIHIGEMIIRPLKFFFERRQETKHLVINNGDPAVATFTFNLTEQNCRSMVAYGYDQTTKALDAAGIR